MNTEIRLPADPDTERLVLGAMLVSPEDTPAILGTLEADDFSLQKHRLILTAAASLLDRGESIDRVTLAEELRRRGHLEAVDGLSYLVSLDDNLPRVFGLDGYVRLLKRKATLRKAIVRAQELISECCHPSADVDAVARAEEFLRALTAKQEQRSLVGLEGYLDRTGGLDALLNRQAKRTIPTPWQPLTDMLLGGFRPGELILLAARPSLGKSTAAAQIGVHAALAGHGVALFSFEMHAGQIWRRIVAHRAKVSLSNVNRGTLSMIERHEAYTAVADIAEAPIWIDDQTSCTVSALVSAVRKQLSIGPAPELVVVDYLQLMQTTRRRDSRVAEVTEISRQLKVAARDLRLPMLVLSQLSRDSDKDNGRRPELTDLRDSGSLEQDADTVMFLWQERKERESAIAERRPGSMELIVRKQRDGPVGWIKLVFDPRIMTLEAA